MNDVTAASPWPAIDGIALFEGRCLQGARLDPDHDLRGKRIAVIGTGPRAVALLPALVAAAERVTVFQHAAAPVLPHPGRIVPGWLRQLLGQVPGGGRLLAASGIARDDIPAIRLVPGTPASRLVQALSTAFLRRQVREPWLRRQLTPDFNAGCRHALVSSDYFAALQQPNCKLITWPVVRLTARGICTAEGIEHRVDCIVFDTGTA